MSPLSWPEFWVKAGRLQRFLRDCPLCGIDARARRILSEQLISRPDSYRQLWPTEVHNLADEVSEVIQTENRWPNKKFIPADPCAILFWDPTLEMRIEGIMLTLSHRYGVSVDLFADLARLTFGELILLLSAARKRGQGPE